MLPPPKTDKPCLAGSVAIVAVFVSLMAFPSFTPTKRDNQSSGMVRSADLAIEAKRHGQARGKATTVPELGCGLPRRLTDRKTAGQSPAASIRRAPMLVMLSVQPAGGLTEIGLVARKSSPGTQAYQNVPMPELLELAFVRVIV